MQLPRGFVCCGFFRIYVFLSCGHLFLERRFGSTQVQEEAESVSHVSGILHATINVLS